ncbi:MAG TPA: hypothetical protein VD995_07605 [Azospirillum sp.]|nr:hypothetical protein [Azospirillum sp.]
MQAGERRAVRWAIGTVAALAGVAMGGCSYSYTDEAGNRRIIGFVDMTVAPAPPGTPVAGSVVDVTTLGVAITRHGQGGHLSIGYTRDTVAVLRDDALVVGNPLAARPADGAQDNTKGDAGE